MKTAIKIFKAFIGFAEVASFLLLAVAAIPAGLLIWNALSPVWNLPTGFSDFTGAALVVALLAFLLVLIVGASSCAVVYALQRLSPTDDQP